MYKIVTFHTNTIAHQLGLEFVKARRTNKLTADWLPGNAKYVLSQFETALAYISGIEDPFSRVLLYNGHQTEVPDHFPAITRYPMDGKAVNIELLIDRQIWTLKIYGAPIYSPYQGNYHNEQWLESLFMHYKAFYGSETKETMTQKINFLTHHQALNMQQSSSLLDMPIPIAAHEINLDFIRYHTMLSQAFRSIVSKNDSLVQAWDALCLIMNHRRSPNSSYYTCPSLADYLKREPAQLITLNKGSSFRIGDTIDILSGYGMNRYSAQRLGNYLFTLYSEPDVTPSSIKRIVTKFCNRLLITVDAIHSRGDIIWHTNKNSQMGLKDISLSGTIFDPAPLNFTQSLNHKSKQSLVQSDIYQIYLSILAFSRLFYRPRSSDQEETVIQNQSWLRPLIVSTINEVFSTSDKFKHLQFPSEESYEQEVTQHLRNWY